LSSPLPSAYESADAPLHAVPSFGELPVVSSSDSEKAPASPVRDDDEGLRMRVLKSGKRQNQNQHGDAQQLAAPAQPAPKRRRASSIDPVAPNSHRLQRKTGEQHYDAEGELQRQRLQD
jgi:hypothetical protein